MPTASSMTMTKTTDECPRLNQKPTLIGRRPSAISLRVVLSIAAMWSASKACRIPRVYAVTPSPTPRTAADRVVLRRDDADQQAPADEVQEDHEPQGAEQAALLLRRERAAGGPVDRRRGHCAPGRLAQLQLMCNKQSGSQSSCAAGTRNRGLRCAHGDAAVGPAVRPHPRVLGPDRRAAGPGADAREDGQRRDARRHRDRVRLRPAARRGARGSGTTRSTTPRSR